MPRTLTDIDRRVGARLTELRKAAGLSQGALGQPSGVTFQQVQKYETGANRLSAGRIVEFAATLKVPVARFFEGIEAPVAADVAQAA